MVKGNDDKKKKKSQQKISCYRLFILFTVDFVIHDNYFSKRTYFSGIWKLAQLGAVEKWITEI